MSSDQISEQPLPPEEKRCPQCGAVTPADAEMCESCLEKHAIQEGMPDVRPAPFPTDGGKPTKIGAIWAMAIGLVVLFGVAQIFVPGVVCVAPFAVPPFLLYLVYRKGLSGVAWFVMIVVVAVCGYFAFAVACSPPWQLPALEWRERGK